MDDRANKQNKLSMIENLSKAIFTVNRHAKTAPNPKYLYLLKKRALEKLVKEGKGKKIGLHFSNNPKFSQQQSDVLISLGDYYFHMPPTKADFEYLPHLGTLNQTYRNPKAHMPLTKAKNLLQDYVGMKEQISPQNRQAQQHKPVFKKLGESYF